MKNKNGKKTKADKSPEKVKVEDSKTQTNEKDKSKKIIKQKRKKTTKKVQLLKKKSLLNLNQTSYIVEKDIL